MAVARSNQDAWTALCRSLGDYDDDALSDILTIVAWRIATTTTGVRSMKGLRSMIMDTLSAQMGWIVPAMNLDTINVQRELNEVPEFAE
jgi:hypothetical protein